MGIADLKPNSVNAPQSYFIFFLKKNQLFSKNVGALDIEDTLF